MKKAVAALFALAIPLSFVQAQDTTTTVGTYTGSVAGKCFATAPTFSTTGLTPNQVGKDQFSSELRGTGTFSYRSNTANCRVQTISEELTAPEVVFNTCAAKTTDLDIATAPGGTPVVVDAAVIDRGDGVLLAGDYTLKCTVVLTAGM